MSLTLSVEQEELRTAVRRLLETKATSAAVRHHMDTEAGYDPALWQQMADQMGLHGLAIPEEYGGSGFTLSELAIVAEELGRALVPSPFFATVGLAAQFLLASGDDDACRRWLPRIADGSLTATVAVCDEAGLWDLGAIRTTATADAQGWSVSGTKMFVVDGDSAGLVLVIARDGDGLGLFAVESSDGAVRRSRLDTLDPTRRLGRIELDNAQAQRIGRPGDASGFLQRALDLAVVVLGAEQIGGAQACLDDAVAYSKVRVQFDRAIGSFQAIKHKCADILLDIESGRAAVLYAVSRAADPADAEFGVCAAAAASYCSLAYSHAAKENIQIHGGIGFTWEHDSHLHLKRAKTSELLFGTPAAHRARVAELTGI